MVKKHGTEEHKQKAIHDKNLAENLHHDNAFPDWVVTCSFYSALHCVDAYAHKLGIKSFVPRPDENTTAHKKRELFVERNLKALFGSYEILLNRSEQCRYDPEYYRLMLSIVPNTMLKLARQFFTLVP
jgi:hypothetical protein